MSVLAALLFVLLSHGTSARRYFDSLVEDCVPAVDYKRGFRFFPETFQLVGDRVRDDVEIEVADDFLVQYSKNYKIVQNLRVNETYVLYQCGTQPPMKFSDDPSVKLFEIPLTYVALADTTSSSFIAELGVTDRVHFASSFATDACLQKISHRCRRVAQDPGSSFADPLLLRIQNRRADAVFVSGASNHSRSIAFTATMDPAVLKRAEWVKFVALFFNKEREANAFFDKISETWNKFKFRKNPDGPLVAWISFQDFDGNEFFLHFAPYKMEYITAAGGRNLNMKTIRKMKGVTPTNNGFLIEYGKRNKAAVKLLHEILKDVDVVIDETYQSNNTAYDIDGFYATFGITSKKPDFKFAKSGKVFRLDRTIGKSTFSSDSMDWYETGVARPDLVLKDLQIAFGTRKHKRHERTWLRNLSDGELPEVLTHKHCDDFKFCSARPDAICPSVQVSCLGDIEYRNGITCQPVICD